MLLLLIIGFLAFILGFFTCAILANGRCASCWFKSTMAELTQPDSRRPTDQ